MTEDEEFENTLENHPVFICSQLRAGDVLDERSADAIAALVKELDDKENEATEAHARGRLDGIREVGGDELVTAVQIKDDEWIAQMVRRHMDKLFPKDRRTQH